MSTTIDHETIAAWMTHTFPHGFRCPTCTSATVTPAQAPTPERLRLACARCGYVLTAEINATDLRPLSAGWQDREMDAH